MKRKYLFKLSGQRLLYLDVWNYLNYESFNTKTYEISFYKYRYVHEKKIQIS